MLVLGPGMLHDDVAVASLKVSFGSNSICGGGSCRLLLHDLDLIMPDGAMTDIGSRISRLLSFLS